MKQFSYRFKNDKFDFTDCQLCRDLTVDDLYYIKMKLQEVVLWFIENDIPVTSLSVYFS